jgi:hypothetical protein
VEFNGQFFVDGHVGGAHEAMSSREPEVDDYAAKVPYEEKP